MKKAIIVHGWGGSPEEPMHKWIKLNLEEKGYEVVAPEMPNTDEPEIEPWIDKLKEVADINEETIFIGHSIGCQAILRYLERLKGNIKVRKSILIAPWIETPIDWQKVRTHCDNFICIFSDNDPFVPLSDMKLFKEKINAETLLLNNKGHFDPDSGIKELPEILQFIN